MTAWETIANIKFASGSKIACVIFCQNGRSRDNPDGGEFERVADVVLPQPWRQFRRTWRHRRPASLSHGHIRRHGGATSIQRTGIDVVDQIKSN